LQFAYQPTAVSLLDLPRVERQEASEFYRSLLNPETKHMVETVLLPLEESLEQPEAAHAEL
jgi:hypothetical protein